MGLIDLKRPICAVHARVFQTMRIGEYQIQYCPACARVKQPGKPRMTQAQRDANAKWDRLHPEALARSVQAGKARNVRMQHDSAAVINEVWKGRVYGTMHGKGNARPRDRHGKRTVPWSTVGELRKRNMRT